MENIKLNISNRQRKKAFAFMDDMKDGFGYISLTSFYGDLKLIFSNLMDYEGMFSLSPKRCSQREYDVFMDWLLDIFYENGGSLENSPLIYFDDIENYIANCMKHKRCCITGAVECVHIHHVDKIQMGNNRRYVDHSRYRRMPLRADYHDLVHRIGEEEFNKLYHVLGVKCNYWNNSNDRIDDCHGFYTEEIKNEIKLSKAM